VSQEDIERLDEDEAATEEQDDESPDAEGHKWHGAARASDPAADAEKAG
jgi:hypothetical protein